MPIGFLIQAFQKRKESLKKNGFSLIEVLIITSLLGLISLGILSHLENSWRQQKRQMLKYELSVVKGQIEGYISDPVLWTAIMNDSHNSSGNFSCLQTASDCSSQTSPAVNPIYGIVDVKGTVIYNLSPGGFGFDHQGNPCNGFSNSGNDKCPFSYSLRWEPLCTSNPCINPNLHITGTLLYKPKTQALGPLNPAHYNIDFIRYNKEGTVAGTCSAIGGTYDPATQKCNLPVTLAGVCSSMAGTYNSTSNTCTFAQVSNCPVSTVMTGTNSDGTLKCDDKLAAGSCPQGQVSLGFKADGSLSCIPLSSITGSCASPAYAVQGLKSDGSVNCVLYSSLLPPPTPTPTPSPSPSGSGSTISTSCSSGAGTFPNGYSCTKVFCQSYPGSFFPPTGHYTGYSCSEGQWQITGGTSLVGCDTTNPCPSNF